MKILRLFIVIIILCSGCAILENENITPLWVKKLPVNKTYKYYRGQYHNAEDEDAGIEAASQDAYEQIIKENFGIVTTINKKVIENLASVSYSKEVNESSKNIYLKDIAREDIFFKKKRKKLETWVLFKVSRSWIKKQKERLKVELDIWDSLKHNNNKRIKEIIAKNSNIINIQNDRGNTIAHIAAKSGNYNLIKFLVSRKTNINVVNKDGDMPSHLSIKNNHNKIAKYLIFNGADVTTSNQEGINIFNWVATKGYSNILKFLLDKKEISPNTKDGKGRTPLHTASMKGKDKIIRLLLTKGANPDITDNNNLTALEIVPERFPSSAAILQKATLKKVDRLGIDVDKIFRKKSEEKAYLDSTCNNPKQCKHDCEMGVVSGCFRLGKIEYAKGNIKNATSIWNISCIADKKITEPSCEILAESAYESYNIDKAAYILKKVCDNNNYNYNIQRACKKLGYIELERGRTWHAEKAFARLCELKCKNDKDSVHSSRCSKKDYCSIGYILPKWATWLVSKDYNFIEYQKITFKKMSNPEEKAFWLSYANSPSDDLRTEMFDLHCEKRSCREYDYLLRKGFPKKIKNRLEWNPDLYEETLQRLERKKQEW